MDDVTTMIRIIGGVLLVAHGMVHLLYLSEDTPEFTLESWLVPAPMARAVGLTLIAATIAGFVLLGVAVWGAPGLSAAWPAIALVASGLSILLIILFWHPHLIIGVGISITLIITALLRPGWTDRLG